MRAIKAFLFCLPGVLVTALSADLLYLYYAGGWCDPIKWIETLEIIVLWTLCIAGLAWLVWIATISTNVIAFKSKSKHTKIKSNDKL